MPLLREASAMLGSHLPIMDVAQILGAEFTGRGQSEAPQELHAEAKEYLRRAKPIIAGKDSRQHAFLLVPASAAGRAVSEIVGQVYADVNHVSVPGQSDLMFLREQGCLTSADLQPLLKACRSAYESASVSPIISPHARLDITDWLPLDP